MQEELEAIKKVVEDNQRTLALLTTKVDSIRRRLFWSSLYGTLKFIVIVGSVVWSLWYFQPQIQQLMTSWQSVMQRFNDMDQAYQQAGSQQDMLQELQRRLQQNP